MCNGLVATIIGTDGDDVLAGTWDVDVIVGLGGDDEIFGASGADVICGGPGADVISGESQDDRLFGDAGDDVLDGGSGDDVLDGGNDVDMADGSWQHDVCANSETVVSCETVTQSNPLPAGAPPLCEGLTPTIVGTEADDTLVGTWRADVIVGLGGNDTITGGSGADTICAGLGNDVVNGDSQDDVIVGGPGDDTIRGASGADTISGGPGKDTIDGESQNDSVHGGNGDDTIVGGPGDDSLDGGYGIDVLDGLWQIDSCDDAETALGCESITSNGEDGLEIVDTIPYPEHPQPMSFPANSAGFDGVELTVHSSGGLYPWDVQVDEAYTTPAMKEVVVSELIDLRMNPDAAGAFDGATLELSYDADRVTVPETELLIWTYDAVAQFWVPAGVAQTVDVEANTVTAALEHFSIYAVLDVDRDAPNSWTAVLGDVPAVCVAEDVNVGADVVFTVDTSGSMSSNDPSRLRVQAAKVFVQAMSARDRAGVVSFSSSAATRSNLRPLDTDAARAAVNSALDLTGAASGGTNISAAIARTISLLESSPAGRPRIGLLLTDGDGTYSRADAQAAADANVTIYTVGLGTGVNRGVLSEIAEVTGGEFIQLSAADQLVPLYEQLGDRIFDDGPIPMGTRSPIASRPMVRSCLPW